MARADRHRNPYGNALIYRQSDVRWVFETEPRDRLDCAFHPRGYLEVETPMMQPRPAAHWRAPGPSQHARHGLGLEDRPSSI
jgi:hypothetical protein